MRNKCRYHIINIERYSFECGKRISFVSLRYTTTTLYFKITPKKTRTNYFKFSFFNRYITDWNSIPSNIMHASSMSSFKSYLLDHLCQF